MTTRRSASRIDEAPADAEAWPQPPLLVCACHICFCHRRPPPSVFALHDHHEGHMTAQHPSQAEKAARFAALHKDGCFILPNAWDVPSAGLIAEAGFPAIATTSSGIAFAGGLPDGEKIGVERMFAMVAEIAARVPQLGTGDRESGSRPPPDPLARAVELEERRCEQGGGGPSRAGGA